MPDESPPAPAKDGATPPPPAAPRPRARAAPKKGGAPAAEAPPAKPAAPAKTEGGKAPEEEAGPPKHPKLSAETVALLRLRRARRRRQPVFYRQAANRYYRIGRDGAWRRPRGLQSKQRRHYGYRSQIVSIGFGSPARVRGLAPSGYRPVIVSNDADLRAIDPKVQAAVIARTVGTRRRLGLEEAARKLGVRVLNPIQTAEE
jgi:large subunit ribosomal protein L32e